MAEAAVNPLPLDAESIPLPIDNPTPAAPQAEATRLPAVPLLLLLAEIIVVIAVAILITWNFGNDDPKKELLGGEAEWLTNFSTLVYNSVHQFGYIPLWQPYLQFGHPAIDNPFSYILNPVNIVPSIIYGQEMGIRITLILTAILAGLGGWVLGRVLGFGWTGRLLLAMLCFGKGNIFGVIEAGFFQLSTSQVYIPWVLAGAIGVLRLKSQRWPILLTAIFFALMFFTGDIWYTLPTVILIVGLLLTHAIHIERFGWRPRFAGIDWLAIRRMVWAGLLTAGLVAVFLLPIYAHKGYIDHPTQDDAGPIADPAFVVQRFFDNTYIRLPEEYYSYVLPDWFALSIAITFVVITAIRLLVRARLPRGWWRVWSVVIVVSLICIVWGIGGTPLFVFLYRVVPLLNQWRFVGRALGITSLGLAMLAAGQVDVIWKSIVGGLQWLAGAAKGLREVVSLATLAAAIVVAYVIAQGVTPIANQWHLIGLTIPSDGAVQCVTWLRQQYPNKQLAIYDRDSYAVAIYFKQNVRVYHLSETFGVVTPPNDGTLYHVNMYSNSMPEYGLAWDEPMQSYYQQLGWTMMMDSPGQDKNHCLWHNPNALAYAYSLPLSRVSTLDTQGTAIVQSDTTALPDDAIVRHPDRIWLAATGLADQQLVVTIQELNYPGWYVQVDGQPARLESIGGQIGVLLPAGAVPHQIMFYYHPPLLYLGAVITLLTALLIVLYGLRADRFIPPKTYNNLVLLSRQVGVGIWRAIRWLIGTILNSDSVKADP